MSAYSERLQAHLARYKATRLGVDEDGVWTRTGRAYPHILPTGQLELNILPEFREAFWAYARAQGVRLHRDFHHLTSSQAFTFNLFFPFFAPGGNPHALLAALDLPIGSIAHWGFEAVLDRDEGSNFDVHWVYADGGSVVCEVKLSEGGFGAARKDAAHIEKRDSVYRERLAGKVDPSVVDDDTFFVNYQVVRNVAFADPGTNRHAVFVLPRDNAGLRTTLEAFIGGVVSPSVRSFVHVAFLEDILQRLTPAIVKTTELQAIVRELRAKYLPSAA